MSRLYVEIVCSRSSPAYYDFLPVSNPTNPTCSTYSPSFHFAISFSCFSFRANFITVTAEQICEISNCYCWKVRSKFPFYYLRRRKRLNYLEILLNENLFLWFSEALEYAADALLEFFSRRAHPPHMSFLKSRRHFSHARKKNIGVSRVSPRDIKNYIVTRVKL